MDRAIHRTKVLRPLSQSSQPMTIQTTLLPLQPKILRQFVFHGYIKHTKGCSCEIFRPSEDFLQAPDSRQKGANHNVYSGWRPLTWCRSDMHCDGVQGPKASQTPCLHECFTISSSCVILYLDSPEGLIVNGLDDWLKIWTLSITLWLMGAIKPDTENNVSIHRSTSKYSWHESFKRYPTCCVKLSFQEICVPIDRRLTKCSVVHCWVFTSI